MPCAVARFWLACSEAQHPARATDTNRKTTVAAYFYHRDVHASSGSGWQVVGMSERGSETECLHCEITKVVEDYMERRVSSGSEVNLPDIADMIVESLAQFILEAIPVQDRAKMIAYALEHLGQALSADEESGTRH